MTQKQMRCILTKMFNQGRVDKTSYIVKAEIEFYGRTKNE